MNGQNKTHWAQWRSVRNPYVRTIAMWGLLAVILLAVLLSNQPYDQFHGWWIFGYTEHVVPHSYLIAAAWLITLAYLGFLTHWYRNYHPEQVQWSYMAMVVIVGGVLSIAFTVGLNALVSSYGASLAGVIEEPSKFAAMWLLCRRRITDIQSGLFFAVLCALGFAAFENIMYFMNHHEVLFMRANPAHAVFSSFWGAAYGACRSGQLRWSRLWFKWMPLGIIFHGCFNTILMLVFYPLAFLIAVRLIIKPQAYFDFILGKSWNPMFINKRRQMIIRRKRSESNEGEQ